MESVNQQQRTAINQENKSLEKEKDGVVKPAPAKEKTSPDESWKQFVSFLKEGKRTKKTANFDLEKFIKRHQRKELGQVKVDFRDEEFKRDFFVPFDDQVDRNFTNDLELFDFKGHRSQVQTEGIDMISAASSSNFSLLDHLSARNIQRAFHESIFNAEDQKHYQQRQRE